MHYWYSRPNSATWFSGILLEKQQTLLRGFSFFSGRDIVPRICHQYTIYRILLKVTPSGNILKFCRFAVEADVGLVNGIMGYRDRPNIFFGGLLTFGLLSHFCCTQTHGKPGQIDYKYDFKRYITRNAKL